MSDPRIADRVVHVKMPRNKGKIEHGFVPSKKYEMFGAYQFRIKHDRKNRNFSPTVPIRREEKEEWYLGMYRLKINGRWYKPDGLKYVFLSPAEIALILVGLE